MSLTLKTIGQAAKETNTSTHTLRYYEKEGLLNSVTRNNAGQRVYNTDAIQDIHFIKRAQNLQFSLNEIKQLLQLSHAQQIAKPEVRHFIRKKQALINNHIEELIALRDSLDKLLDSCEKSTSEEGCPIINKLTEP